MDYEEENFSQNRKKYGTGLIVTLVCAILIVVGAAWFAISRFDKKGQMSSEPSTSGTDMESDVSSVTSKTEKEYEDITSSYNDIVSDAESFVESEIDMAEDSVESTKETAENVSSVPYTAKSYSMPVEGEIIKEFNDKQLQYSKTLGDMRMHYGIDIACKAETSVSACSDGKVLNIEDSSTLGTVLTLVIGDGLTAKYAALKDIKVEIGDSVKIGDILGVTATVPAECNEEEHLHFELYKNNSPVDPIKELGL